MGTSYSIKIVGVPAGTDVEVLAQEVDQTLETVNLQMSTYRPDSELSRFNAAAVGEWVPVSPETRAIVEQARQVNLLTGGAFDPTVGPIVDLWGFGPEGGQDQPPNPDAIAALRPSVGMSALQSRGDPISVSKQAHDLRLDLSGIAKGFGVDQVAELLDARGATNYLVEVGGELRASGLGPKQQPWRVGIEKPVFGARDVQRVIELDRAALATSGNYRFFFDHDGKTYCHIIDPTTGRPVTHDLASATVAAASTVEADALSTALLVLGPDAGMTFATDHDIAAFFISGSGGSFRAEPSPAFERQFTT